MRVLHVEVGGRYGGSLRGLEVYLAHSRDFEHDVLLYYKTPGAERLEGLARRVWTLEPGSPPRESRPVATDARGLLPVLKRLGSMFLVDEGRDWAGLLRDLPRARRLHRLIRSGGYDAVHANNTFTFQAPTMLAARWAGIPVVSHGRNPVRHGPYGRAVMRRTDAIVTDSDSFRKHLASWNLGVPLRTCYNCVQLSPVDASRAAALRASLVPPGGVLVGSLGRLDEQKGYEYFVDASRQVVDARPDVWFAVAGEGPSRGLLERRIAALGLAERFRLCGFSPDAGSFIAALDVFASSSLWEGLPLAVVEAMLLGKPVVATDVGGNRELIVPGRTGRLVPARDARALAAAILEAVDPAAMSGIDLQAARVAAAAVADPGANARALDAVLEQVVAAARGKRAAGGEAAAPA
jgi:glycosyltransferase involved in cell wall biosynthesis